MTAHPPDHGPAAALVTLVLAAIAGLGGRAECQDWPQDDDLRRGRLFSLPRSQDQIHDLQRATAELAGGAVGIAVERLHQLLTAPRPGVVPADAAGNRYFGLRRATLEVLRNLDGSAQTAYDELAAQLAGPLVTTAFEQRRLDDLEKLAHSYPTASFGRRAARLLGDLALERGDALAAAMRYRAALDALPDDAAERADLQARLRAARVLHGDAVQTTQRSPLPEVDAAVESVAQSTSDVLLHGWPGYGGGGDGARVMHAPLGSLQRQWGTEVRADSFPFFAMHAVGDAFGVVVNDGQQVRCFDPLRQKPLWAGRGPMLEDPDADARDYQEAINRDFVLAAALAPDVVVAALQVPNNGRSTFFRHIEVIHRIPRRRLFAFDRATGARLWAHYDSPNGPITQRFAGYEASAPPLIIGDTAYVGAYDQTGAIAYYLVAIDLHSGQPKWRRLICSSQGEVNMFGNSRREYAGSPLAYRDGVVYGGTNLGVCFAADAATGDIRWVTPYRVIQMPETRLTEQQDRRVFFANNPVVVADGVMAATPLDSAYALGFDAATGEQLWRLSYRAPTQRRNDIRWLLGAIDDEFIFSGMGVVAVKARGVGDDPLQPDYRQVVSPQRLGVSENVYFNAESVPRGALDGDTIYYSSLAGLQAFGRHGDARRLDLAAPQSGLANLLLVDGIVASLRNGSLDFYYDLQRLEREAERSARDDATDPAAVLRLASLLRASAHGRSSSRQHERAEKLYRRGLELARDSGMSHGAPVYRRLAQELFEVSLERALSLYPRQPEQALELVRTARDQSVQARQWLEAQRHVLDWVAGDPGRYVQELRLMATQHGAEVFSFEAAGRVPVAAYALWREALVQPDPVAAMQRAQELVDRYPEVILAGASGAELGRSRQAELVAAHGREAYAGIEAAAAAMLERARGDADMLRTMVQRYPLSEAARGARNEILDLAVQRGDLSRAIDATAAFFLEGAESASLYRRLMLLAEARGNRALAGELRGRLLRDHADERSDHPADRGLAYRDALEDAAPAAGVSRARPALPQRVGAELRTSTRRGSLRPCPIELAEGFAPPAQVPVLVARDGQDLLAFAPASGSALFEAPLFELPYRGQELDTPLLCGSLLVLTELERVRGVDALTGALSWEITADKDRVLQNLGCRGGVLHLFSEERSAGDGGILLGIEPTSGAMLFRRVFAPDAESQPPVSSHDSLWLLEPGTEKEAFVRRLDPLTGRDADIFSLSGALLEQLDLSDRMRRAWRFPNLHTAFFADELGCYLPVSGNDDRPSRLVALDHRGQPRWRVWSGYKGRELVMAARRGDSLVLVESGRTRGRVVVLDRRTGAERKETPLGADASVRNWRRGERDQPAPDALLITDRGENLSRTLTCFVLEQGRASFRFPLPRGTDFVLDPVLEPEFLALPTQREEGRLDILVLDPANRRSLLPGGTALRINPQPPPPYRLYDVGSHLIISSSAGLHALAPEAGRSR